jgi:aromatic ring-opening dioxygenase catalytic subunit (LigB family)
MAEYIHLIGAEDVRSAGHTMSSAAQEMQRAAGNISHALEMHQRFLDDWLLRFQSIVDDKLQAALVKEEEVKEQIAANSRFGVGA